MPLIEGRSRPSSMAVAVASRCTTAPTAAVPAIGGPGRSGRRVSGFETALPGAPPVVSWAEHLVSVIGQGGHPELDWCDAGKALGLLPFLPQEGEGEVEPSTSPSQASCSARARRASRSSSISSSCSST
jgi:hypothetical protein